MLDVPATNVLIVRVGAELADHDDVETSAREASSSVRSWTSLVVMSPAVTSVNVAVAGCIDSLTPAVIAALDPTDLKVI